MIGLHFCDSNSLPWYCQGDFACGETIKLTKSYLNSEPYGIGELIARKKHLKVPPHQRDYAWGPDEVAQLLEDVFIAIEEETEEYFLGLLVIVGPIDGQWMVLDGQQRLATCTMVLAAVRFWLQQLGRDDDATQIQRQFIGVRRLGGDEEPRVTLNRTNRDVFSHLLRPSVDSDEVRKLQGGFLPGTSNFKLVDAYLTCRATVGDEMNRAGRKDRDAFLYRLADFLENQAQVVCLEVDKAADAYKIFESLNDRGMALSALDLFKNFAFGTVSEVRHAELAEMWEEMASQIADSDAEDFLKVVWTAMFGRVQRGALFSLIRKEYSTEAGVLELIQTLAIQAELYTALLEPSHHAWAVYKTDAAALVSTLRELRSRQVRPIILSALGQRLEPSLMTPLLKNLVALTVRYQTIGRRRTGLLEIACAKASKALSLGPNELPRCLQILEALIPSDEEFCVDFQRYRERNSKRALHVLLGIESVWQFGIYRPEWINEVLASEDVVVAPIISKDNSANWVRTEATDPAFIDDVSRRLGNLVLLTREQADAFGRAKSLEMSEILKSSKFHSTAAASSEVATGNWGRSQIDERQTELSRYAAKCWKWESRK